MRPSCSECVVGSGTVPSGSVRIEVVFEGVSPDSYRENFTTKSLIC